MAEFSVVPGDYVSRWVILDPVVLIDDAKDVKQLSLVFMDPLHVNVVHRGRIYSDASLLLQVLRNPEIIGRLESYRQFDGLAVDAGQQCCTAMPSDNCQLASFCCLA